MRVMYIAPRFHTNQIGVIKGWIAHGDEVCFVSHYEGKIEDHSVIEPIILGYSKLFQIFHFFYTKILFSKKPNAGDIKLKCGFPPMGKLKRVMDQFEPELIILRERSVYSICAFLQSKRRKIPTILYNQSPVWEEEIKDDLAHRLVNALSPASRMTPVMGTQKEGKVKAQQVYFIPFVMEPRFSPEEKRKLEKKKRIEIFAIGKYEERKNHRMLVEVIRELRRSYPIHLTIAGECSTRFHQEYYGNLERVLKEQDLEESITLWKNLNKEEIEECYKGADIFVIPSTKEPASISQLEAMAFSLPVICSDKNGTACYVEEGVNGFLFKDNDRASLQEKLDTLLKNENRDLLGEKSYHFIKEKYSFIHYYNGIKEILENQQDK